MSGATNGSVHRPPKPGKLSLGQGRKLLERYLRAHRAFTRGDFRDAIEQYGALSMTLAPHFAAIVRRNLGSATAGTELSDDQLSEALAGVAPDVMRRMNDGREAKTASLCSAVAHDAAMIGRHLAEGQVRGRDPEVADAIIRGFAHAIAVNPASPTNYHNLAGYEAYLGRDAAASNHYRCALELDEAQWESWIEWGNIYARNGQRDDAELCWQHAFRFFEATRGTPDAGASTPFALSFLRLLKGDYLTGWAEYETRLACPPYLARHGRPDLTMPLWDGQPFDGSVYLHAEQGVGDALMMARYVPLVRERCRKVYVEVIRGLVTLFRAMVADMDGVEVVNADDDPPPHDVQLPMFSLPHRFRSTLEDVPDPHRFRVFSAENVAIQPEPGRIGLCWAGSATHPNDHNRSAKFEHLFPILDLAGSHGFTFQSLQFGAETGPPLDPLGLGDFLETARAIARCSLVISVDTSVCHLAGSMGVPTWVLLPHHAEWRWLQDRDDSPWYPTMRLFRAASPGDWKGTIARVVGRLSNGELR